MIVDVAIAGLSLLARNSLASNNMSTLDIDICYLVYPGGSVLKNLWKDLQTENTRGPRIR